jgi:prophage regulatory protein
MFALENRRALVAAWVGIEPTTHGLTVRCTTSVLPSIHQKADVLPISHCALHCKLKVTTNVQMRLHGIYTVAEAFLRLQQVQELVPLSKGEIYARIREGKFPNQIRLSHKVAVWRKTEVEAWMEEQK